MKKKIVKYKSGFSNQVIKLTVDERKTGIDLRKMAPLKLAIVNEALKGVKFPD
ncbi:hypothetical protein SAMN05428949_5462 [Chitinophaga sp. YR627]|uniref:hypothetical protein n=1 Tax=Chitinophaga sp. YR627 TaxID=1881041 RepID=UPI0008EE029B|nr:hypothetical protein [Chitinophaga sp. YR627]SFO50379.1 hypothetical protein SAMN05428949_5462 [Chitinophaga sp. YR627]